MDTMRKAILFLLLYASGLKGMEDQKIPVLTVSGNKIADITPTQLNELIKASEFIDDMYNSLEVENSQLLLPDCVNSESFNFIMQNSKLINRILDDPQDWAAGQIKANLLSYLYSQQDSPQVWDKHALKVASLLITADSLLLKNGVLAKLLITEFDRSFEKASQVKDPQALEVLMNVASVDPFIMEYVEQKSITVLSEQVKRLWGIKARVLKSNNFLGCKNISFHKENLDTVQLVTENNNSATSFSLDLLTKEIHDTKINAALGTTVIPIINPMSHETFEPDKLCQKKVSPNGSYAVGIEKIPGTETRWKGIIWDKTCLPYQKKAEVKAPQDNTSWENGEIEDIQWNANSTKVLLIWKFAKKRGNFFRFQVYDVTTNKWTTIVKGKLSKTPYSCKGLSYAFWTCDDTTLYIHGDLLSQYPLIYAGNGSLTYIPLFLCQKLSQGFYQADQKKIFVGPLKSNIVYVYHHKEEWHFTFIDPDMIKIIDLITIPSAPHQKIENIKVCWSGEGTKCALVMGDCLVVKAFYINDLYEEKKLQQVIKDNTYFSQKLTALADIYAKKCVLTPELSNQLQAKLIEQNTNPLTGITTTAITSSNSQLNAEPRQKRQRLN